MTSTNYSFDSHTQASPPRALRRSRLRRASCGVAVAMLATALNAVAEDLRTRFERVGIGVSKDATVALMGSPPASTKDSSTLGVSTTTLRWNSAAGETFTIKLLFDRVIEKSSCDRRKEC